MIDARRHEWAVITAEDPGELAEHLARLDQQGYMIRNILATPTGQKQQPLIYTVIGVRDRESAT